MIIDANCFLGPYPFRRLPEHDAAGLLRLMDRFGIDQAMVSSVPAVFYRNTHAGNQELLGQIAPHRDRLHPIAAINPRYVGWHADLATAVEVWGVRAIALWPQFHGYELSDASAQEALQSIAAVKLPVVFTQRLEDRRQRHHWDVAEDLTQSAVVDALTQFPELRVFLCNWNGLDGSRLAATGFSGRCLIDLARLDVLVRGTVGTLIEQLGAEAVAFGTHAPFDYVGPSLVKLAAVQQGAQRGQFAPAVPHQLASENARRFFQLG